jgi:hypothetical protein
MSKYSMSLLPVLLSPSSISFSSFAVDFLWASPRPAVDVARLLGWRLLELLPSHPLLLLRAEGDEDDKLSGFGGFLRASHLSSESARLLLLRAGLLVLLTEDEAAAAAAAAAAIFFLLLSHRSHEDARPGLPLSPAKERRSPDDDDDGGVGLPAVGLVLCASHLSATSARLGLGGELVGRMTTHGGVGRSGGIIIMHLGGAGSSPGRAACAMARCTRATGIAMDRRSRDTMEQRRRRAERSGFRS